MKIKVSKSTSKIETNLLKQAITALLVLSQEGHHDYLVDRCMIGFKDSEMRRFYSDVLHSMPNDLRKIIGVLSVVNLAIDFMGELPGEFNRQFFGTPYVKKGKIIGLGSLTDSMIIQSVDLKLDYATNLVKNPGTTHAKQVALLLGKLTGQLRILLVVSIYSICCIFKLVTKEIINKLFSR